MSAYKGSTGTTMGFAWSCRHRWGPWEIGRTQRWRECTKCELVDSEDLQNGPVDLSGNSGSRSRARAFTGDPGSGPGQ